MKASSSATVRQLDVAPVSGLFRALGDETRLRIVALLAHGELCVCHLQSALAISQPNVSRHLAVLRSAGVVGARRVGTWMYYRLEPQHDPRRSRTLAALLETFTSASTLKRDVAKLVRSRGPESPCR